MVTIEIIIVDIANVRHDFMLRVFLDFVHGNLSINSLCSWNVHFFYAIFVLSDVLFKNN